MNIRSFLSISVILFLLAISSPLQAEAGKGWCRNCRTIEQSYAPADPDAGGLGGLRPPIERNHQQYSSVYPSNTYSQWYFPDFYVSAGSRHAIQQTYPDNRICYHRVYDRLTGQQIVGIWLEGNNANGPYTDRFDFSHNGSTSRPFRHSVQGCQGQVQVYYWHGPS